MDSRRPIYRFDIGIRIIVTFKYNMKSPVALSQLTPYLKSTVRT